MGWQRGKDREGKGRRGQREDEKSKEVQGQEIEERVGQSSENNALNLEFRIVRFNADLCCVTIRCAVLLNDLILYYIILYYIICTILHHNI